MIDRNLLAPWVRRFLLEHLVAERNLARSTQMSYRDTLTLLLPFVSRRSGVAVDRLSVGELQLGTSASVRMLGKGNKWRVCPLWSETVAALRPLIADTGRDERVFRGRTGKPMTRFGIHRLVASYGKVASLSMPSLAAK